MNLQESIRRILREDQDRKEKLKSRILNMIKTAGLSQAISTLGGIKKLLEVLDIHRTFEFLDLFKDMELEYGTSDGYDHIKFKSKNGIIYFEIFDNRLYVNQDIRNVVSYIVDEDYFYYQLFMKRWFYNTYNKEIRNIYII